MRRGAWEAAATVSVALALSACVPLTPQAESSSQAAATAPSAVVDPSGEPSAEPATASAIPLAELDLLADPHAYEGPSTATMADAAVEVLDPAPLPTLPVAVTSHTRGGDVEVHVADTSRVVAFDMSGSIAATLWALGQGGSLVGRDVAAEFPGTEDIPVVTGSSHTINPEAVLELEPSVVITDGSIGPTDAVEQIADAGVPVVHVENEASFDGAGELARQVAAALGVASAGEDLAAQIARDVAATRAEIAALAPEQGLRVMMLYLRGASGIYYMFGDESGADDLVAGLAGVDVAAEIGLDGMKPLTDEAMLAADPEVILVMSHGLDSVGGVDGLLEAKPAIALTAAGQHRRIVDMADSQLLAFGPRSAAILDALARAVYAPES
ncbi:hemin ABC transporter substrate-binding protein [Demequina sp. NBRC 110055]|uniref:heme/hemin ABC transporter substrate-binding protein n=1 Tax=Demequina sp. NBRC 110055 TaxID=1570344 RepID=UPI001F315C41|nr:ABC transporter substrate-binding protein [Demequina sp. NBRC 110055]